MKLRYVIKTYDYVSETDAGICLFDTVADQSIWSLDVGSKLIPNVATGRGNLIRQAAKIALAKSHPMTSAERMYWLTHAAILAADDALSDAIDNDADPEDVDIDEARHYLYEASWSMPVGDKA